MLIHVSELERFLGPSCCFDCANKSDFSSLYLPLTWTLGRMFWKGAACSKSQTSSCDWRENSKTLEQEATAWGKKKKKKTSAEHLKVATGFKMTPRPVPGSAHSAYRTGWRCPPPSGSGNTQSWAQRTQRCPSAGGGRTPGYLNGITLQLSHICYR